VGRLLDLYVRFNSLHNWVQKTTEISFIWKTRHPDRTSYFYSIHTISGPA